MRTTKILIGIVACGLGLAAGAAPAEGRFIVNLRLTALMQAPITVSGHSRIFKPAAPVKITTKDILNLIAENNGHPDGYYDGNLLVEDEALLRFYVYNGDPNTGGVNLLSVNESLLNGTYGNTIISGVQDTTTSAITAKIRVCTFITFDDSLFAGAGNSFKFYGTSYANWRQGPGSRFNVTFNTRGFAEGELDHTSFYATGTESGVGRHP
jgi:hypothetical protein